MKGLRLIEHSVSAISQLIDYSETYVQYSRQRHLPILDRAQSKPNKALPPTTLFNL
jgi:hypothetical protein